MLIIDEEDRITFLIENTQRLFKGQIFKDSDGYYISSVTEKINGLFYHRDNDYFLIAAGFNAKIKQRNLYDSVLGYWIDGSDFTGIWPWCKTKEQLFRILYAIDTESKDAIFIDINMLL